MPETPNSRAFIVVGAHTELGRSYSLTPTQIDQVLVIVMYHARDAYFRSGIIPLVGVSNCSFDVDDSSTNTQIIPPGLCPNSL